MTPIDLIERVVTDGLAGHGGGALVVGLCGAQGSGKSTIAAGLAARLEAAGRATAILSLDDLYLTRAERAALAREVHPLLATRGVPGTHDVALGMALLDALRRGEAVDLPRFDKARDDRAPGSQRVAPAEVVIFEGWCVGAVPQPEAMLAAPVNALEAGQDGDGRWRRAVNAALGGAYQGLFARVDRLVLLAAPGFDAVGDWRREQERKLRAASPADAPGVMADAAIDRFIAHYERLTRWILAEMPARADAVIRLGRDRTPIFSSPFSAAPGDAVG